jgi:hypothetical protein
VWFAYSPGREARAVQFEGIDIKEEIAQEK